MAAITRRDASVAAIALALFAATSKARGETPSTEAPLDDDAIRAILAERVGRYHESIGMVVGVTTPEGRRVVSNGVYGVSDPRPVAGNTLFGIASLSKPFTAFLLADAVLRGEVALTDPAARYLPASVRLPDYNGRAITLIDLATHTSGLPHELPPELQERARADPSGARALLYDFLASVQLTHEIGSAWSYSNLEYSLIAYALEQRTGLDYETLLRRRLLDPLALEDTAITLSTAQQARRAHPHTPQLAPSPEWNKPWSVSVLQSTADDLLTFLQAAMGRARRARMSRVFASMLEVRRPAPPLGADQALGWYIYPYDGRPMIGHSGGGGGFASSAFFDPQTHTGVVVLSNAENLQEDVARHALRPSVPLDEKLVAVTLSDAMLDAYAGQYSDAAGGHISVTHEPTGLVMRLPQGYRVPLTPQSETRFFVQGVAGMFVEFAYGSNGETVSLAWTLNGVTTPAQRLGGG